MTTRIGFKRVVVGLNQSTPERATVRVAAELAGLLRIDLFGLFIEDPAVAGFAGLAGAREYQLLGRRWQQADPESLSRQIELCARSAQRLIDEAARGIGVPSRFEIVRAAVGEALKAAGGGDIVIVAEPQNPSDRAIAPFPQLLHAAFSSEATVLYVPRRIARAHGPVVAVAMSPDDPSIAAATAIAAAARENLIVLDASDTGAEPPGAGPQVTRAGGVPVGRLRIAPRALQDQRSLCSALGGLGERMIVVTRGAFGEGDGDKPADLASLCGVPVLLVEPADGAGGEETPGAGASDTETSGEAA